MVLILRGFNDREMAGPVSTDGHSHRGGSLPADRRRKGRGGWRAGVAPGGAFAWLLAAVIALSSAATARAVPSFARQMDMQCIVCHTGFPLLNAFGRSFKLTGYTLSTDQSEVPPFAVMLQPSFTHTAAGQEGGAAAGFGDNNNWALTQASFFYAGRLFGPYATKLFGQDAAAFLNHFGTFVQVTYDGVGKTWSWDNAELRYAATGTIAGQSANYGFYLNNNPTLQDPWNSTPAWGFPFSGSGLAPTPAAATLIDGGLSQQVGGAGAYVMVANTVYLDLAAYRTLGARLQKDLGVDPAGETQIAGAAPCWRIALERPAGSGTWEIGTFGLAARTYPGGDGSMGKDRILDLGLDSEYQVSAGSSDWTVLVSWIHERQSWDAGLPLGLTANAADTLWNFKATVNYLYDKTYGAAVQYFSIGGDSDPVLYSGSATGSPESDGFILQADYFPLNKRGGPAFWSRSNVKLSLQYVVYNRFDGARTNFDGAGRNARDNNTLYLEAWIAF